MDVIKFQAEIAQLGLDLGGMMALVVERVLPLVGADGAAVELAEGDEMVYQSASGIARGQVGLRIQRKTSLSGLCVATGQAQRCDDSESDHRVDRTACRRIGLRSMVVIPLKHNGEAVGVLKAMSALPAKLSDDDVAVLNLVSDMLGASMYFATHYGANNLFYLATHDALTGLSNRSLFMDRLRNAIVQRARDQRSIAVLMIDMNGFKQINDSFGHRVGDAVLQEFANRLNAGTRDSDTVARIGGDEFAVILTPVDTPHGVEKLLQRLQGEIDVPFVFEGHSHQLKASIGCACSPEDFVDIDPLLDLADKRMYATKSEQKQQGSGALH